MCVTTFPCSPLFSHNSFHRNTLPNPTWAHMQYGNCSIVLENLWEEQKRRRNRVQWWRWLGNQIHSSASKGARSLCSTYWSVWNIAGLVLMRVNPSSKWQENYTASICFQIIALCAFNIFSLLCCLMNMRTLDCLVFNCRTGFALIGKRVWPFFIY